MNRKEAFLIRKSKIAAGGMAIGLIGYVLSMIFTSWLIFAGSFAIQIPLLFAIYYTYSSDLEKNADKEKVSLRVLKALYSVNVVTAFLLIQAIELLAAGFAWLIYWGFKLLIAII
jgi:hypothetical protein